MLHNSLVRDPVALQLATARTGPEGQKKKKNTEHTQRDYSLKYYLYEPCRNKTHCPRPTTRATNLEKYISLQYRCVRVEGLPQFNFSVMSVAIVTLETSNVSQ